jgi:hydrogenase maturation protease
MIRVLVISCGNPVRADDGVAWRIAESLEETSDDPTIRVRVVQQLTPELAEEISHAETVVFVDAVESDKPGAILLDVLPEMPAVSARLTHSVHPAALLGLARSLCGRAPDRAFLLTVGGSSFEFSEALSAPVALAVPEAVRRIQSM